MVLEFDFDKWARTLIKVKREQHYVVLSRVLSNKLPLTMSTQNYICLRQLIPVAVKLVKNEPFQ